MAMRGSYDAYTTYSNKGEGEEGIPLFAYLGRQEYAQKPIRPNQLLSVKIAT